ncbi:MAG: hypothetical protein ACI4D3_09245 [Lachnospiraceae bacterium]
MSRKIKDRCNLQFAGKQSEKDQVEEALESLTTAHSVLDEQEAEAVRKKIQELPDEIRQ